ncbi:MATE family efflux transporter [Chakrabartyella piscis]|uniref:MATE family efflux transporter n=1 Tax=Chakrabartyella piscis TaxID=2918914 RepID=UPI0029584306|nr:MATE family efflux transporter [Chakrabartyella piscis]
MSQNLDLTKGRLLPVLLQFTYPILLSILLQTTYGTADLLIVGQFANVADVSGVTIGSMIMLAITSCFTGLSMGTTILIARYIGSGQGDKSSRVVGVSIFLFALLALVFTAFLLLGNDFLTNIMQTPTESISNTKSYLYICGAGTIFIVSYNLLGSIFRGLGDSKTPLLSVAIACIINIVLDLLFVAKCNMGSSGAALATVIAQASSVVLSILIIRKRKLAFSLSRKDICFDGFYIKNILSLGIPVAMQGVLVTISFLSVTAIINVFGVAQSAAVGIVEKITNLVMVVPQAFAQALAAFTAQNLGAKEIDRAKKGLFYSITLSLVFGVMTAFISAFHGTIFTKLFTSDAEITTHALLYLRSYSIDCILVAIMFSYAGFFNGCGKTTFVMIESILGAFCIRIPLAYLFSTLEGTNMFVIGLATPSSTFVQIILCVVYYRCVMKREHTLVAELY